MDKLKQLGISGRMLDMIVSIYKDTTSEVITQKQVRDGSGSETGLPTQPYIVQRVHRRSGKGNLGGTVIGKMKVFALKYADDVALVADDTVGLKEMLTSLAKFAAKNDLQINTKKNYGF